MDAHTLAQVLFWIATPFILLPGCGWLVGRLIRKADEIEAGRRVVGSDRSPSRGIEDEEDRG